MYNEFLKTSDLTRHDPKYDSVICCFNFDENVNEAITISTNLNKLGNVKIHVYGNEGKYPHFHIVDTNKKFHCCIRIDACTYFSHGTKTDKLTKDQKIDLMKILKSKCTNGKLFSNFTNWEVILAIWNAANETQIDENIDIPNYLNLR